MGREEGSYDSGFWSEPVADDDYYCPCVSCRKEREEPPPPQVIPDAALPRSQVGMKFDADKPRVNLLPWDALLQVAHVLTFGAKKYAADSWRTVPNALDRYEGALLRHWIAKEQGEWLDPESGLPHWAHIACNALFCCALACAAKKLEEGKKVLAA